MSTELVEGVIESIVFSNPDNGYTILRLSTSVGAVTASGCIPGALRGERLVLHGAWVTHPQYGEQFKVETFESKPPNGPGEMYQYLASGAISNIGPAKAREIVREFGSDALYVIENEPERLSSIKGISMKRALMIGEGFRRQAELKRLIDFFAAYEVKPLVAIRVYKDYGDESLDAIRENPYIIASDKYGAEFSASDAIAMELGFASDSPERLSAAIIFELTHNLNNGHVFIPKVKLMSATDQLIGAGHEAIEEALDTLCECGDVVTERVAGEEACYLRHMYDAERYTAARVLEMATISDSHGDTGSLIAAIERENGIEYAQMQRRALELASVNGIMALTGGPGTGKTTTVRGIIALFDSMGLRTMLCAPTGRAAKRLAETCGRDAATIHRMLGASPGDDDMPIFDHNETNPLKADAVIVDESSMIDVLLIRSLLEAMKRGSRFILVGDADQLPPVGPGSAFADIIKSGVVPTVTLSEIFRQAEDSGIVRCSHNVNKGLMPDLSEKYPDLFFLRRQTEEQISETVAQLYGERLPKNMGIDASQIQVLSPTRKGAGGTAMLNERLRETVNPRDPARREKHSGEYLFRVGDKVMQIRNNYDIIWKSIDGLSDGTGVYNGDVGFIVGIDNTKETVTVDYEDKLVEYLFEQLPELEPAFAITVHKSQGSEYHAVILSMTAAAPPLLTRSVLYTAMTRAKKLLIVVGNADVMEKMVGNDKRQRRYSGLRYRLVETI